jgi:hypothetical protein
MHECTCGRDPRPRDARPGGSRTAAYNRNMAEHNVVIYGKEG